MIKLFASDLDGTLLKGMRQIQPIYTKNSHQV